MKKSGSRDSDVLRFCISMMVFAITITANGQMLSGDSATQEKAPLDRRWQFEILGTGGFPPGYTVGNFFRYQEEVRYFTAGVGLGRTVTGIHGKTLLRGRGEALIEVDPLWCWHEPRQNDIIHLVGGGVAVATFPGFTDYGLQVVPARYRWNFLGLKSGRFVPWAEAGAGLLWTGNRFPQGTGQLGGNTSNVNFTPQIGVGSNVFVRSSQSVNVGVELLHISNAGLGEYDPGVSALEFRIGYVWRK